MAAGPTASDTRGPGLWLPLGLAAAGGALMFVAFPPADLGEVSWIALPLVLLAFLQCGRPWQGGVAGAIFGFCFYGPLLAYIARFGTLPWLLVVVLEAIFTAVWGSLVVQLRRLARPGLRVVATAGLWVVIEYLREHRGPLSLPLGDFYYCQWNQPSLLQLASVGGGHLITFMMVLLGAALAVAAHAWLPFRLSRSLAETGSRFRRDAARALLACYVAFFAAFFWGNWVFQQGSRRLSGTDASAAVRLGYVQASVPMGHTPTADEARRAAEAYFTLTETLPDGLDLIVWPETALAMVLDIAPKYREQLGQLALDKQAYILAGASEQAPQGKLYNTLFLLDPQGQIIDRYRKVHLIVFGEYVPWRERLRFLERFPIRPYDYAPGEGFKVLRAGSMTFGPLICFEALFPAYTRLVCRQGAQFIVVATSDHWARDTYELAQHSRTAMFRAVEARRWVARAATDGESMVITPYGQRLSILGIGERGAQVETILPVRGLSMYHRLGDAPLLLVCALVWIIAVVTAHRAPRPAADSYSDADRERAKGPGPESIN